MVVNHTIRVYKLLEILETFLCKPYFLCWQKPQEQQGSTVGRIHPWKWVYFCGPNLDFFLSFQKKTHMNNQRHPHFFEGVPLSLSSGRLTSKEVGETMETHHLTRLTNSFFMQKEAAALNIFHGISTLGLWVLKEEMLFLLHCLEDVNLPGTC